MVSVLKELIEKMLNVKVEVEHGRLNFYSCLLQNGPSNSFKN